jgi:hypothetical protein
MDLQQRARTEIERLTAIYSAATGLKPTTVLARAVNDARFLSRTENGERTFTFRLHKEGLLWFARNWPENIEWPEDVPRPAAETEAA